MFGARRHGRITLDPIYGYIPLPDQLAKLIDNPMVQRLRRVSQTSTAQFVYPSLTSQRFPHSLDAMFLAMEAWNAIWRNSISQREKFLFAVKNDISYADEESPTSTGSEQAFLTNVELAIGAAALLHDVGHPPFSHALEWVLKDNPTLLSFSDAVVSEATAGGYALHEYVGLLIAKQILTSIDSRAIRAIAERVLDKEHRQPWVRALRGIIDSEIDIDRIDYLLRDNYTAGTEYGSFDFERIISSVEIQSSLNDTDFALGLGSRARSGAEQMLLQRSQTFRWVIFHPRVVASDHALGRSVDLLAELATDKSEALVDGQHHYVIASLFQNILPDLNYVTRSSDDHLRSLGFLPQSQEPAKLPFNQTPSSFDAELRASVDDALIHNWIRTGVSLAQALLSASSNLVPRSRSSLERLIIFGRAALHRNKALQPVWKNFEEYQLVADAVLADDRLLNAVDAAYNSLSEECSDEEGTRVEALRAKDHKKIAAANASHSAKRTVEVLNYFASLLVQRNDKHLSSHLSHHCHEPLSGIAGFWEATYRDFRPLSPLMRSALLFKDADRVSLQSTSPLVQSLEWIDAQRVKLFVFFCRSDSIDSGVELPSSSEIRLQLQGDFVNQFCSFVEQYYARRQRELIRGNKLMGGS